MKQIFVIALLLLSSFNSIAQNNNANLMQVVSETQIWNMQDSKMKFVWWIPTQYWVMSAESDPMASEEVITLLTTLMDQYTILAALDCDVTGTGIILSKEENNIFIVKQDVNYRPIPLDDVDPELIYLLNVMKPAIAQSIGRMGEGMEFYVFPRNDADGNQIANPEKTSILNVSFNGDDFIWDLPLSTFIPPLVCPVDNEELNGKWKFCPHHGKELEKAKKD